MYIYIDTYAHRQISMYPCMHVWKNKDTYNTCVHVCVCLYICVCACIEIYGYTCRYMYICIYTQMCLCVHVYIYICV